MTRATYSDGSLAYLVNCYVVTPFGNINLKILPDISDTKAANWVNEGVPGRSSPLTTYERSDARAISTEFHFMVTKTSEIQENLTYLRIIESLVYPGEGDANAPFYPPMVSKFICGKILGDAGVCVILKSYSVKFPTDVAIDPDTMLPYKFSVSCSWEVVYSCNKLPTNYLIKTYGGSV